jgi:hypothetical protein
MLTIREGFYYRNRKGEKIGPMRRNADPCMQHPWIATEKEGGIEHYKNHGGWHWDDAQQSQYDLISEWPEQPEPTTGEAGVEQEASTGYYIEGKEVTQDELYRHVGAKVFYGLRKGNLPGCSQEVMRLRELLGELTAERDKLKGELEKMTYDRDNERENRTNLYIKEAHELAKQCLTADECGRLPHDAFEMTRFLALKILGLQQKCSELKQIAGKGEGGQ